MTLEEKIVFEKDNILVYPNGITPVQLVHTYDPVRLNSFSNPIPFEDVHKLLDELLSEVKDWYLTKYGEVFNNYKLGDRIGTVRERFWSDEKFRQAFKMLELDYSDVEKATIPWWNEIAAGETSHTNLVEESGIIK
ncbi:hypothetical protein JXC34_04190, partial [Candidatus Woesearchaeota archaeon]|nr:hypothetical protein [Candidatus Woesearchaeota archaeon]